MRVRRIPGLAEKTEKAVAAYARVSTCTAAQEESLDTQVSYYAQLIRRSACWTLVQVYADEGISAVTAEKRPGFMRMMGDAREGKIDIILCKSISRFSRNVLDACSYIRELKQLGVEVCFEKEALSTFDHSSELIFHILAAASQEESRQISENVKWSYRKHAEKGVRHLGNHRILGYDEIDGKLTPNGSAWIVKLIYQMFAAGRSMKEILSALRGKNAARLRSRAPFDHATVRQILKNEVYCGDRILQKRPPRDFLTKKPSRDNEFFSVFLTDDHMPIVDRDTWERVKERLQREQQARALRRREKRRGAAVDAGPDKRRAQAAKIQTYSLSGLKKIRSQPHFCRRYECRRIIRIARSLPRPP